RDRAGKLEGIFVDEWRLWEKQTGIRAEIHAMDWGEAVQRMRAGEFEVIDTVFETQERTSYWDFSKPFARIDVLVFFRKEVSGLTGLQSLKGFPVAAKAGDAAADLLQQNGITTVLLFTNYEAIVEAAKQHKVNVFVMDEPPALYFLHKQGLQDEFRRSAPVNTCELRRAVRKGDADLLRTVEAGFAALSPAELKQIEEKWRGKAVGSYPPLRYLGYVAVLGLLLISALVIWNVLLNRLVNRRTAALRRINRTLRMLTECIQLLVRADDETELLQAVCRLVVEAGGYRMAWVGFAEQDEARSVRPVARAGFEAGYLDAVNATWADNERGRGPTGTAIRTGKAVIARNILTEPAFGPWRKDALQRGYAASATLPLKRDAHVLGALMVYADEAETFDADEVALLTQLAGELTYGIMVVRARAEKHAAEQTLRQLTAHLLQVQDLERRRLARELHDTTAQNLAALTLNLANLKGLLAKTPAPAHALCCDCIQLANLAAQEIRTHSYLLHPPLLEVMGLAGAVEDYAQGFSARSGIAVELEAPAEFGRLPEDMELALFRVIQESLANVLKHSGSRCAKIHFTRPASLITLEVQDMGHGI
ncbi:MAG: transporter substrate-binding domain-containing protein, partial [Verrucomicrobia bacterium]|nr:transporter substrate-binding domain-containing protein [Verrucomicrobiota bacterium]